MISRCSVLIDHLFSTKRARQVIQQFRMLGRSPSWPKLLGVRTMPCPK